MNYRLITLFFTVSSFALSANKLNNLITGPLLFIQSGEPAEVFIDGKKAGSTPLFLKDVSADDSLITLKNSTSIHQVELQYNPDIQEVTRYSAPLSYTYGYLSLNEDYTVTWGENKRVELSQGELLKLPTGPRSILLEKEGYFSREISVEILPLETVTPLTELFAKIPVTFSSPLPEDSVLVFSTGDTELQFTASEDIHLYAGRWSLLFTSSMAQSEEFSVTVNSDPVIIEMNPAYFNPALTFSGFMEGSQVLLNGEAAELTPDFTLSIPVGTHRIDVVMENYLTISETVTAKGNSVTDLALTYEHTPAYLKNKGIVKGFSLLGTGIALLAGGLIWNMDSLLVDSSSDYETYKKMKYISLGVAGLGITVTGIGGVLTFNAFNLSGGVQ